MSQTCKFKKDNDWLRSWAIFKSKPFHDWSIKNMRKQIIYIRPKYFAASLKQRLTDFVVEVYRCCLEKKFLAS